MMDNEQTRMVTSKFFIIAFTLLACKSFENKKQIRESIKKISYKSYSGDKGGNFFDLEITADSTALIFGNRNVLLLKLDNFSLT